MLPNHNQAHANCFQILSNHSKIPENANLSKQILLYFEKIFQIRIKIQIEFSYIKIIKFLNEKINDVNEKSLILHCLIFEYSSMINLILIPKDVNLLFKDKRSLFSLRNLKFKSLIN